MVGGNFGGYYDSISLFDTYPGKFTPPLVLPSLSLSALINWSNKAGGVVVLHMQEMDTESFYGTFFNFNGLFEDPNKNFWYLTVTTSVFSSAGVWLPKDAYAVDVKIDDGLPRDGKMRSISGRFGTGLWDPSGTACVDKSVTPYQYNIQQIDISAATYTNILCAPFIMTSF